MGNAKMKISGVIFDLGNTLIERLPPDYKEIMHSELADCMSSLCGEHSISREIFLAAWKHKLKDFDTIKNLVGDSPGQHPVFMEYTADRLLYGVLESLSIPTENISSEFVAGALKEYYRCYVENCPVAVGVFEVLEELERRNIKLALISNAENSEKQRGVLRFTDLEKYFPIIVISADVGFRKPDSRIFDTVLESWKVPPEEIIMVGDKLNRDVLGALRTGMHSAWLRGAKDKLSGNGSVHIIPGIPELLGVIDHIEQTPAKHYGARNILLQPTVVGFFLPGEVTAEFLVDDKFPSLYRRDFRFVRLDSTKPLDDQQHVDILFHKLTRWIVQDNDESKAKLNKFNQWTHDHPEVRVIDGDLSRVSVCANRQSFLELIQKLHINVSVVDESGNARERPVIAPRFCVRHQNESSGPDTLPFEYPVIIKSVSACSLPESHEMSVVFRREGLMNVKMKNCIVQEYIDHDALLFKVFVLWKRSFVVCRQSLPNFECSEIEENSVKFTDSTLNEVFGTGKFGTTSKVDILPSWSFPDSSAVESDSGTIDELWRQFRPQVFHSDKSIRPKME
eukprot:281447_1